MLRNRAIRPIFEKYPSAHTHEITDEDENGLERLSNASSPNAFHDSSARHPPPRCHPGTRLMQLENLARWAVVGEKRLLWLKGPAGVGKSAIAQTLAEAFELESRLGAAFFFSRPNRIDDAQRLFPSIAFQLSQRYAVYAEALERRIRRDPSIMAIPLLQQFRNTIVLPLQGVVDVQSTKLVVIIDGLDECQGIAAQMEIVQIIASSVRDATTPLLWVFTSRPESHLAEIFTSPDVAPLCLNVDVHDSRADVECFLIDKLRSIRQRATNLLSSQWPSMEAINVLVDLSHGRFIFASTAAILMDYHSSGQPDRLLENILELEHRSIPNSPVSPMSCLDDLYTLIVNQVPIGSLSTAREILLASTLPGICTSAVSIANLLRVSEPQLRESLRGLRPFVSVVSTFTGPEVCFYHASFLDFLEDPARSHSFSLIPSCVVTLRNKLIRQLEDLQHIQQPTRAIVDPLLITWRHGGRNYYDQYGAYSNCITAFFHLCQLAPLDDPLLETLTRVDFSTMCLLWDHIRVRTNMNNFLEKVPGEFRDSIIRHYTKSASIMDEICIPTEADPESSYVLGRGSRKAFCWGKHGSQHFWIMPYPSHQVLDYVKCRVFGQIRGLSSLTKLRN